MKKETYTVSDCPLDLSFIPNTMGINLVAVDSVTIERQDNLELTSLTINFNPELVEQEADPVNPCSVISIKGYTEQEMLNFARRMILEYLLGNTLLLTEEGALRAKLPPATPAY